MKVLDHMYDNTDEQQSRSDHLMDLDASAHREKANLNASKVKAAVEQNMTSNMPIPVIIETGVAFSACAPTFS